MESIKLPSMNHLYQDRTLFVTGASGFVGKVLIEKMLYSLPGIKRIFILIRASRGKSGAERWSAYEKNELFNRIRRDCPDRLSKVVPIEGDISLPNLGISQDDLRAILEETSVVFHCAATVRFNESLKRAVDLNMRGVLRVISLCHRMPNLKALLHCSSCYANADKQGILVEEKLYPPPCDPHRLIEADDWMTEAVFESIGKGASKTFGNTYCFTKCLAEHLFMEDAAALPGIIFRPSIISGVWRDGIPGWADALQGVGALITAMGTGAITRIPMALESRVDCVPVDVVCSAMLVCAAYRMSLREASIPIVHCNSSTLNPLIYKNIRSSSMEVAFKYPLMNTLSTPVFSHLGSDTLERSMHQMREKYLGPSLDKVLMLFGQKPFFGRLYGRVSEAYSVFRKFLTDYTFQTDNLMLLMDMLTEEDKEKFDIDVRKIDWNSYTCDLWLGMKVFLMKDDIVDHSNVRRARWNIKLHQMKDFVITFIICFVCSVAFTGTTSAWQIFVPLTLIMHFYCSVPTYESRGVPSIDNYKKRIEDVTGETIESMQLKKIN